MKIYARPEMDRINVQGDRELLSDSNLGSGVRIDPFDDSDGGDADGGDDNLF